MDRKKRKQKYMVRIKKRLSQVTERLDRIYKKYDVAGVEKVGLSENTQADIGIMIGTNFTVENPWNYVDKDRILDNLDDHSMSSEFLSLKTAIEAYPEERILMGYEMTMSDNYEEFFICTTVLAKDKILTQLEKDKEKKRRMTQKKISKFIRKWISQGSEPEVEDQMIKHFRPLYVVEINSDYPITQTQVIFNLRLAQDSNHGYVELTSGRFSYINIQRKRVDSATQVAPARVSSEVQTTFQVPANSSTQYEYLYDDNLLGRDLQLIEDLRFFLRRHKEHIFDSIMLNNAINFYINDYEKYAHMIRKPHICTPEAVFSVKAVITCKDMQVSSISWHPLISGIIAVAYTPIECTQSALSFPVKREPPPVDPEYIVLIWSYCNQLRPILTLIGFSPILKLSFCPHDGNVLVGGCRNGSVVLWDLKDRLQIYNTVPDLPNDKGYRTNLRHFVDMDWWKNTIDESKLYPTAVSNMNYSHSSEICDIGWISPDYRIDNKGRFKKTANRNRQFITTAKDSMLLIWSLNLKKQLFDDHLISPQMARRISLFGRGSPYKVLNTVLRPIYKLLMFSPKRPKGCLLENISVSVHNLTYVADNPDTRADYTKYTFFQPKLIEDGPEVSRNLILTTTAGTCVYLQWEGYDFDPGLVVNFENAKYFETHTVHDGPVRTCAQHTLFKDIMLTVGGRVFAIWNQHNRLKPVVWRKCEIPYVSGMWSPQDLCHVFIARQDSCLEIWNLHEQTKFPLKIIRCPGNLLIDIYCDNHKRHSRKGTFLVSDTRGQLKLYLVPNADIDITDTAHQYAKKLFDIFKAKQDYCKLIRSMYKDTPQRIIAEEHALQSIRVSTMVKKMKHLEKVESLDHLIKHKYMEREEKQMYELMFKKKNINIDEIESHRGLIQVIYDEKRNNEAKLDMLRTETDTMLKNAITALTNRDDKKLHKREFDVIIPSASIPQVKKTYFAHYEDMEPDILKYVRRHRYKFKFNWNVMLATCLQRWRLEHTGRRIPMPEMARESDFSIMASSVMF